MYIGTKRILDSYRVSLLDAMAKSRPIAPNWRIIVRALATEQQIGYNATLIIEARGPLRGAHA